METFGFFAFVNLFILFILLLFFYVFLLINEINKKSPYFDIKIIQVVTFF